jgi:hypothetical protein
VQDKSYMFLGAATLAGKEYANVEQGGFVFRRLGGESRVQCDVEEQDIYLC